MPFVVSSVSAASQSCIPLTKTGWKKVVWLTCLADLPGTPAPASPPLTGQEAEFKKMSDLMADLKHLMVSNKKRWRNRKKKEAVVEDWRWWEGSKEDGERDVRVSLVSCRRHFRGGGKFYNFCLFFFSLYLGDLHIFSRLSLCTVESPIITDEAISLLKQFCQVIIVIWKSFFQIFFICTGLD